ncbi:hypothetical protein NLG97_g30 [Lecanicillium saksenae]|uniref:Uncharacterized protein n=1 Tax=Lecanicillium saksenae TaxID=468837 RepID=A0ACC1R9Q1_9HYPO|nr:hypothetical protein NLG97_g30 [Lecanicillium saksenae]
MNLTTPTLMLCLVLTAACSPTLSEVAHQCLRITQPNIPGAEVLSFHTKVIVNGTVLGDGQSLKQDIHNIHVCEVNVTLSHDNANDTVSVLTWLPLHGWNHRFLAVGGGAWVTGQGTVDLALPATNGYAASSTDGGLGGNPYTPASWALNPDGSVNAALLDNFAHRSIHDMAVVGKAVTASFYKRSAKRAYWGGCSTGGRQGMVAAQQYPGEFDGILAGAPAIYWPQYVIAELWPQVVMREHGYFPPSCELNTIVAKAIEVCDELDGVRDGVIADPAACTFDPFTLVGTRAACKGSANVMISNTTASIVRSIWDGPITSDGVSLWPGLPIGASLDALAGTELQDGVNMPKPFFLAQQWVQYFVKQNTSFDVANLTAAGFESLLMESRSKFDSIIGSADPDLSTFKANGGKILAWHGLADQLIFPQDSVRYLTEVQGHIGGREATSSFFRLFMAPGVDHCAFGAGKSFAPGAVPLDPLGALVAWVEDEKPPESLLGETISTSAKQLTRKICKYPLQAKYAGCGDSTKAESYSCI